MNKKWKIKINETVNNNQCKLPFDSMPKFNRRNQYFIDHVAFMYFRMANRKLGRIFVISRTVKKN